tara:strand:+ start:223 stop:1107 length:885 start_codon:yes stop_codon:yes gene_type:complete
MRTPFKMKSSPAKGKLDNFFKGVSDKAAVGAEVRRTKQVQANQGMTNFEKRQADKAAQRKSGGKSKFQRAGAERKANRVATEKGNAANAADKAGREANSAKIKAAMDPKVSNASAYTPGKVKGSTPKAKAKVTTTKKKVTVEGKLKSKTRKDDYDKKGWAYDETIKGYNRDASRKNFVVQTSVKKNKKGVLEPQTTHFNTKPESDAYIAKNKGSFGYQTDKDGKRIKAKTTQTKKKINTNKETNTKKETKKYKAPKKKANIFSSGLDLTGKYLNKLDRALGFKTVPKFMRKYDK